MSGSGSAVFGLFRERNRISDAIASLGEEQAFRISLVSRVRYRAMWWRALAEYTEPGLWPPQSRYLR
jgi:hypothetical protein